jgi:hypothetical protein
VVVQADNAAGDGEEDEYEDEAAEDAPGSAARNADDVGAAAVRLTLISNCYISAGRGG